MSSRCSSRTSSKAMPMTARNMLNTMNEFMKTKGKNRNATNTWSEATSPPMSDAPMSTSRSVMNELWKSL